MYLPEEEYSYGLPNRPSTPMNQVMSHGYGNVAAQISEDLYKSRYEEKRMRSSRTSFNPKTTKTHFFRKDAVENRLNNLFKKDNPNQAFKIGKFKVVKAKVDHDNKKYKELKRSATAQSGLYTSPSEA